MPSNEVVSSNLIRFGDEFELDRGAYELRRAGQPLRLARIPMELLLLLLEQPGQLVTREQIADRVWGKDVFLDIDNGINAIIRRLRQVLEDDPEQPRFIQTVVGRGYRFIATVQEVASSPTFLTAAETQSPQILLEPEKTPPVGITPPLKSRRMMVATVLVFVFLIVALMAWRWFGGSRGHIESIAVLPFVNSSGDPDVDYLSDGITEGIINGLSQLPQMRVLARSTVFRYKGHDTDPQKVGHDLAVRAILAGTLARHGDDVRVQAELIDVTNGAELWGEQYDRKLSDLAAVQQEVVRDISDKLRVQLKGEDRNKLSKRTTETWEAYDLYLRGRFYWNKFSDESLRKAVGYFQQAIEKDPSYALAYAGLADAYHELSYSYPPREMMPKAKAAALKAMEWDDSVAEAHAALGWVKWTYDWDWVDAEKEFQRSIELSPNYGIGHGMYALYLDSMSRVDEAAAQHKRAQELEPLSLIINTNAGEAFYDTRRYDQAIEQYRKTLEIDEGFAPVHDDLAKAYERKGMYREAVAEWQKGLIEEGRSAVAASIGHEYSKSGYKSALQIWLDHLTSPSNHAYVSPFFIATFCARLGESNRAFEWLAKAYQERDSDLVFLRVEPALETLRSDPRFAELERKIGFPSVIAETKAELPANPKR